MNKIEMEIVALQSSVANLHSYAIVLGEINGTRRVPIVIGGSEAQAIAIALEKLHPKRPLTHDLFMIVLDTFLIDLEEVVIYKLLEGIFYAKLICNKDGKEYEIDCRTSDALALAIRKDCVIYASEEVINAAGADISGLELDSDEENLVEDYLSHAMNPGEEKIEQQLKDKTLEELEQMLEEVLDKEDYNLAIKIRDEINLRK